MAAQDNANAGSVRNAIRWGLLLAAVGTAGFRLPRVANEFRAWRNALALGDTSAAQGFHAVLIVDLISVLVVVAIGVGVFHALRTKEKPAR
ncbi:MAG: hypothetical protein WA765_08135 [Candidatus Acidiferrum sp.]